MARIEIVPVTRERFDDLFALVVMLAEYEKLEPPSPAARERLCEDICGKQPRIEAVLAVDERGQALGYAIMLETYSSFLALPTLYLEDIFVREDARHLGAGSKLFDHVVEQARRRGCGRVDWQVLDWNMLARDFYEHRGAASMKEWMLYRIDLAASRG
jgi:GNAT superfamily N-acetyltransferase